MRFLPHDQDTGGFFVAIIQKLNQHDNVEESIFISFLISLNLFISYLIGATKKIEMQNQKNKSDSHELLSDEASRCWKISKYE